MKVLVHISQESPRRKQCESCSAYFLKVIGKEAVRKLQYIYIYIYIYRESLRRKQFKSCGAYFSRIIEKEAV